LNGFYYQFARLAIRLLVRILWHVLARAGAENPEADPEVVAGRKFLEKYQ
jgi:hypothetical protein